MDNLFLVEHSGQVEDLLSQGMKDKGTWIALGPSAMWALDRAGISYKIPEDFYIHRELGEICLKNHQRVEELCRELDKIIRKFSPDLVKLKMQPFLFSMFPLIVAFDALVSRIFQLQAILKVNPGCKVLVHRKPLKKSFPWGIFDFTFSQQDQLWGQILSLSGWRNEVVFLNESKFNKERTLARQFKAIRSRIGESFIGNLVFNIKSRGIKRLFCCFKRRGRDSLLFDSAVYEWQHALGLLEEKGWRTVLISSQTFKFKKTRKEKAEKFEDLIKADSDLMAAFEFRGVMFYSLLDQRLTWIWENSVLLCRGTVLKMKKIIKKYKVKGVLYSVSPSLLSHITQQAARNLGLPVILWQHGFVAYEAGRITQLNDSNNMMTTDTVLTFGREAAKAHLLHRDKYPSKITSVGSASIDKIRTVNLKGKERFAKTILYVTTNYCGNYWYCGFFPPFNDRRFSKDQLGIMESLKQLVKTHQVKVTLKLHPADFSLDPPFISEFSEVFRIVKKSPNFSDLLLENHIIIVDSATTTILQALATEKAVFALMNHVGYSDSARKMLAKRAVCRDNFCELMNAVKSYLEQEIYPADATNDEFLRAYGNHLNDGKSSQRAVDEALAVVSKINAN